MMTGLSFLISFGLCCVVLPCEGIVNPPLDGERLVVKSGSTVKIKWSFSDVTDMDLRAWYFTNNDGTVTDEQIAKINADGTNVTYKDNLPRIDIQKPATLVLESVDHKYNGMYKFQVSAKSGGGDNTATVIIAVPPKITIECSKDRTINKSDDISCLCSSTGGNPPANVTWHDKDGTKISGTGKKKQEELKLTNVDKTNNGSYTCKAFGHELAKNETSIEIIVHFPPENVGVVFPTNMAERGKPYTITCTAEANPLPTYEIFFNETKLQINGDAYTISNVNDSHSGFYHCVAKNTLGSSNSTPSYLRVGNAGQSPTTFPTSKTNLGNKTVETETSGSDGLSGGAIAGIVIGVLVVVVIVAGVIYWFKFKTNGKDHGSRKDTEEKAKKKRGDENVYDAVNMDDKASGSRSSHELESPMNYAVLDKNALKTDAPKKPERNAEESTAYASIDVGKVGQVEADLV